MTTQLDSSKIHDVAADYLRGAACMIRWALDYDRGTDAAGAPAAVIPEIVAEGDDRVCPIFTSMEIAGFLSDGATTVHGRPGWSVTHDGELWAETVMALLGDQVIDPVTALLDDIALADEAADYDTAKEVA